MQEEVSTTENALVVYPNPASTTFTVVVNAFAPNEDVSLSIYNLQGTLVIKRDIKDQRKINFISESALKNGVYFIRASGVAKSYVQRLAIVQ
jgi:flagellar hook assembly protein FlgD